MFVYGWQSQFAWPYPPGKQTNPKDQTTETLDSVAILAQAILAQAILPKILPKGSATFCARVRPSPSPKPIYFVDGSQGWIAIHFLQKLRRG